MKPEDVFTPRSAHVNEAMYVTRTAHEESLVSALRGRLHIVIHGESGSGKSWLYKKVLDDENACYVVANLANASRLGSITAELKNVVDREGRAKKSGYEEEKSAEYSARVAKGTLGHTGQFAIGQKEPFEAVLESLRGIAGKRLAVLVFDNLEAAFKEPFLKELADILILCDDERYAEYNVKIIIVGVPGGLREYYYKTPHHATVSSRLYEIPEVSRLPLDACRKLIDKGFQILLKYEYADKEKCLNHISWVTDRVPLLVHEYCLELANLVQNSARIEDSMLVVADKNWVMKSLFHAYSLVEGHMNERDTKAARRNQVLAALAACDGEHFKAADIEPIVRHKFPLSTKDIKLNVPQTLASLSTGERPLLKRTPKGDAYEFSDPRTRLVMRAMLEIVGEKVRKIPLIR